MLLKKYLVALLAPCLVLILATYAAGKDSYTGNDLIEVMLEWENLELGQKNDAAKAASYIGFVMGVHGFLFFMFVLTW